MFIGSGLREDSFLLFLTHSSTAVFERARVLEVLSKGNDTIPGIATKLGIEKDKVFTHIKDLMRKNLVEIASHEGRDALFRKK